MKRILFSGLVFVFLITGLVGCAKREDKVVAEVGSRKIALGELEERFSAQMRMATTSGIEIPQKERVLEDMIRRELLVVHAYKQGLDKDTEIDSLFEERQNAFLLEELYSVEIADKSKPTQGEIKTFYEKSKEKLRARHILVKNEQEADSIYEALKKGADFEKLAQEKSIDRFTGSQGGDLGFFSWGDMVEAFQKVVFKLQPKEICRPVKTKFGWHIIRLEERAENQLPDFKANQEMFAQQLHKIRQSEFLVRYLDKLKEKENIVVDSLVFNFLLARASQFDSTTGERRIGGEIPPYVFTPVEEEAILVKYRSGQMTLKDFTLKFNSLSPNLKIYGFKDQDGLKELVFQMLIPDLLAQAAHKRGIDKSQSYRKKLLTFKESLMASKMRDKFILDTVGVTPEEVGEYYQKHKDMYTVPGQVRLQEIMLGSKGEADEILKRVKNGEDFAVLAGEKTIRAYGKANGGDLGYIQESQFPELFKAGWSLRKGAVAGPIYYQDPQLGEAYSVIKVLDKKEKKESSFDEVKEDVEKRASWEKKNLVLSNWEAKARQEIGVQIHKEMLGMAGEDSAKTKN